MSGIIYRSFISAYWLFILLLTPAIIHGQSISGKVVDSKTAEPLQFANVFLNNTTIGTVTDADGGFNLIYIKELGTYELVFSFVGYETIKRKVNVDGDALDIGEIELIPSETELIPIEVAGTRDKEWEKKLKI
ncbi:MAG: carboxypeptidase-like regulatory domain-containing protein [Flammeovirgaceae bacterium]|nr:carboxypeptidase-like regulatory domain-containing protein [Flammeovirgaceae bacterium]